jgi:hypothetical protein
MSKLDYCVVFENKHWSVRFQNLNYSYPSRAEAIRAAVETAKVCDKNGHEAEVRVQMPDQKFRTEWISQIHVSPPKG